MSDRHRDDVISLTAENIDEMDETGPPYVVKFRAPWCGHCETFAPIFDEIAAIHSDRVRFGEVNIEDEAGIAKVHRVSTVPTVIVFRGGREAKPDRWLQDERRVCRRAIPIPLARPPAVIDPIGDLAGVEPNELADLEER